jgi:hypothetical protein
VRKEIPIYVHFLGVARGTHSDSSDNDVGAIALGHGYTNALIAISVAAIVIFLTGIPIAYYSAKYGVDMDLLTRGSGFGYLGSTLKSIVYASFCGSGAG